MSAVINTAIGHVEICWTDSGICRVVLKSAAALTDAAQPMPDFVKKACVDIAAHLDGRPRTFRDIPLDFQGVPAFHEKIYHVLRNNWEPGTLVTYGQLALTAGSPGAARAVGSAMKRNPVPILVPCHRVVSKSGPGGFSAGDGLDTKLQIIRIEQAGRGSPVERWL